MTRRRLWWAWFLGALTLAPLAAGCGASWQERGQSLLGVSSRGVVIAAAVVEAERASQCPTGDAECIHAHHLDVADQAIAAAKDAIVAGLNGLATGAHDGLEATWNAVAPCVASAVTAVLSALVDAGVDVPALVRDAALLGAAILGPCREAPP